MKLLVIGAMLAAVIGVAGFFGTRGSGGDRTNPDLTGKISVRLNPPPPCDPPTITDNCSYTVTIDVSRSP